MQAQEVKRGYEVNRHGDWHMVDMILTTWVNAFPGTDAVESRRIVLACGCTIEATADEELEAREWTLK